MRFESHLDGAAMSRAIDQSLKCLRTNFKNVDGEVGWYHNLDDARPGITASAVGLYVFRIAGRPFEREDEVVQSILGRQVRAEDRRDGGWPIRSSSGYPIIEASAWVLRALAAIGLGNPATTQSVQRGLGWLAENQNLDHGWGSYYGQPSRVFTTALAMLALHECGGDPTLLSNATKWLISAQNEDHPAWGRLPQAEPTVFHTSFTLLALLTQNNALSQNAISGTVEWIRERLDPTTIEEPLSRLEEYFIPLPLEEGRLFELPNSLPHFATPIATSALLSAGMNPLDIRVFQTLNFIIEQQLEHGCWSLPRNPKQMSIWAMWPFVDVLCRARTALLPSNDSKINLLYAGCAIVQATDKQAKLTRILLLRNIFTDWITRRRHAVALAVVLLALVAVPVTLYVLGTLSIETMLAALLVPVLIAVGQGLWEARRRARTSRAGRK